VHDALNHTVLTARYRAANDPPADQLSTHCYSHLQIIEELRRFRGHDDPRVAVADPGINAILDRPECEWIDPELENKSGRVTPSPKWCRSIWPRRRRASWT
jgi:hypothetical protein